MRRNSLDCFQLVYKWYADLNKIDIFMHFLGKWYGDFFIESNRLLEKYHGIKLIRINSTNFTNYDSIQVVCNGYNCEWTDMYKTKQIEHSFVLTSYNEDNNTFTLIDPYFQVELQNYTIPFTINNDVRMYKLEMVLVKNSEYIGEVVEIISAVMKSDYFQKALCIFNNIGEDALSYTKPDLKYDPRLLYVKAIRDKFTNIHYCFTKISEKNIEFASVCDYSADLKILSSVLNDLTIKSYIKKEKNISKLIDVMYCLIDKEYEMIKYIKDRYS